MPTICGSSRRSKPSAASCGSAASTGIRASSSPLLALLGAALGALLATGAAGLATRVVGDILPWMGDFRILPGTLLACAGGTLALGGLSTLVPAYRASRLDITEGLRSLG